VFENVSDKWFDIAVQGPKAVDILKTYFPQVVDLAVFGFVSVPEHGLIISRTGYTGEDGLRFTAPWRKLPRGGISSWMLVLHWV